MKDGANFDLLLQALLSTYRHDHKLDKLSNFYKENNWQM